MTNTSLSSQMPSLLIANRGEIARRIQRTAQKWGIKTIAVFSDADRNAPYVKEANEAIHIGGPSPKESYLRVEAIVNALQQSKASALHPGYGFLSENEKLVQACEQAGVTFVGPPVSAMRAMGDKIESKKTMIASGVPVVPGPVEPLESADEAVAVANAVGYPVMLKASAGGGGIGMSRCKNDKQLRDAFDDARKKGEMFFGSSRVFIEKLIENPHHIEVQVLGDKHGNIIHLFDRECSIQRRNQKVLEETPSPLLDDELRKRVCDAGVKAARAVGYVNAGTVEMVADEGGNVYFLEMNTRLQVEHPITEMVTGIDLVEWQLRVAVGEPISFSPKQTGHAIELRICAEDPDKRFFPQPGSLETVSWPSGVGIRVDAGVESGDVVTPYYDSMLAKLIAHGSTRDEAIARLLSALSQTRIDGVKTNLDMHRRILESEAFRAGKTTTSFLETVLQLKS
jgi:acetyl-CoA carboxylase, biotin carboxylase subunit